LSLFGSHLARFFAERRVNNQSVSEIVSIAIKRLWFLSLRRLHFCIDFGGKAVVALMSGITVDVDFGVVVMPGAAAVRADRPLKAADGGCE